MKKTFFLCLLFFLIFFLTGASLIEKFGLANNSQDYFFHWNRVNGINTNNNYPGLFHWLFQFFSFNQYFFWGMAISIFAFFIPFCLFKLAKTFWAVVLYFFVFPIPYVLFFGATYPEALVLLFFLLYCLKRTPFWLILFGILAALTHNSGLALFGVIALAEFALYFFKKEKVLSPIIYLQGTKFGFASLLHVLLFQLPFMVWLPALKKISSFSALMIIASFLYSTQNIRALAIAQLLFCVNAAKNISGYSTKYKLVLLFYCFFQAIFFLGDFALGAINLFYK